MHFNISVDGSGFQHQSTKIAFVDEQGRSDTVLFLEPTTTAGGEGRTMSYCKHGSARREETTNPNVMAKVLAHKQALHVGEGLAVWGLDPENTRNILTFCPGSWKVIAVHTGRS